MAKPKGLKLKDFFNGNRRKATLVRWEHLCNRAGESRIKLTLQLPLLNESVVGMNGPVSDQFGLMAKDDSYVPRANVNVFLEGMTVEMYTTADSKHRNVMCTGGSFHNFFIQAEGDGEKRKVDLHCVAYVAANEQWRDWAWANRGGEVYITAEYSQSELEFSDEATGTDDEADEPETEESDDEQDIPFDPPAAPKKSGPKELAAYHAARMNKPN